MTKKLEATLWRDSSEEASRLQLKLEDQGYNLRIILTGSLTPTFSSEGHFLTGYGNIMRYFKF